MTTGLPSRAHDSASPLSSAGRERPRGLDAGAGAVSPPPLLRVGVSAPEEMVRKISYALEELLAAAGIPYRVERTDIREGWDLYYGERPPGDDSLWMEASPGAWRSLTEPGRPIHRVETVRAANQWVRLPQWDAGRASPNDPRATSMGARASALPDLAAAAFFFLSHWEEWRAPQRDHFGRFPLSASVFGRGLWSLTECPVERYARALREALREVRPDRSWLQSHPGIASVDGAGDEQPAADGPRPAFLLGLSHDIDSVRRWDGRGFARTGRELLRALFRVQVHKATREMRDLMAGIEARRSGRDPHHNLAKILQLEREVGTTSTFFLLARHTRPWDGTHPLHYQRRLPSLARSLAGAAEIGLHASTAATGAPELCEERERLSDLSGAAVRGMRYHNLRGGLGALPDVAAAGFCYDTSLAFAEEPGFPSGIARPFRLYDREQDRPMELIEIPLALMDTSLLSPRYLGLDSGRGRRRALLVLDALRRWGGAAALLWHNDNLPPNPAGGYASLYIELIRAAQAARGQLLPLGAIADEWLHTRAALQQQAEPE